MLVSGEEPLYIARRLVRMASEDIGMADSAALPLVCIVKGVAIIGIVDMGPKQQDSFLRTLFHSSLIGGVDVPSMSDDWNARVRCKPSPLRSIHGQGQEIGRCLLRLWPG